MVNITVIVCCIIATGCIVIPLGFWMKHPELTQMDIINDFWVLYLIAVVMFGIVIKSYEEI